MQPSHSLCSASRDGKVDEIAKILDSGHLDLDEPNEGLTALQWATDSGFADVCSQLIAARANPNIAGAHREEFTPLHLASWNGDACVVERLLSLKASPLFVSSNKATPLHLACQEGHTEVITRLVEAGGSVNVADGDGDRPLHLAACGSDQRGHMSTVQSLLELGANPLLPKRNKGLAHSSTKHRQISELLIQAEDAAEAAGISCSDNTEPVWLTQADLVRVQKDAALQPSREENACTEVPQKRPGSDVASSPKRHKCAKENHEGPEKVPEKVPEKRPAEPALNEQCNEAFQAQQSLNLEKISQTQLIRDIEIAEARAQDQLEADSDKQRREQAFHKAQAEQANRPPEVKRQDQLTKIIFRIVTSESCAQLKDLLHKSNSEDADAGYSLEEAEAVVMALQEKNLLFYEPTDGSVFSI